MKQYAIWMLRSRDKRQHERTGWWVLRSRTLTFERLRAHYPAHDIRWVSLCVPEEV